MAGILRLSAVLATVQALLTCNTQSQPNPIAAQYPNLTTGTINGTVAILPIPLSQARSIIPKQYGILVDSYRQWLPHLPADMYPAMLQYELDHDVGQGPSVKIPDFVRAGISYPFVDRLGDGYTAMSYNVNLLVSYQVVALLGTDLYGELAIPTTFDPPCDAYAAVPGAAAGTTYNKAYIVANVGKPPALDATFAPVKQSPYSMAFWRNVTNQPQFGGNPLACDNYIRLFNSSITQAPYEPVDVRGTVSAVQPAFPSSTTFQDVYGLRFDAAFIENNLVSCESLKGYSGTGPGD